MNGRRLVLGVCATGCMAAGWLNAQTPALPEIKAMPPSVPYRWKNVVIKAGGFVSGIVFSPSQAGLVYARTDVGGAYRSDNAGDSWTPITDQFGRDESSYLGIESVGLDPNDANKVYLAAGMYSADWGGPAAILRSNDKGSTFEKAPMPFKMGGNDDGRGCGERLAVDPNLGSVLYFGSRKAGLWKSVDSAVTWTRVESFPVPVHLTGAGEKTGITFVAFDRSTGTKGTATKAIYVGVAQAGSGLYRSIDGGASWALVAGAPADLFPNHAAVDPGKSLYFSFVDGPGPNGMQNGAIVKFTPADGKWKDVSPIKPGSEGQGKFGFGGLAMDAQHPDTLMVTTIDRWWPHDLIFRTTDGGRKWTELEAKLVRSAPTTPYIYWHKEKAGGTGWMNDIKIDPFNPAKVMYTTGAGIWGSADVTAADAGKPTHWGFPNEGLEETVPVWIVSPSEGAHLLSAVGDVSGFRHEDLDKSPKDGFFIDPQLTSGTSIDFAAKSPMVVVRVGDGDSKMTRGGYSLDNGVSWKPFEGEPPSSQKGGGKVAISADGKVAVWSPHDGVPFWTADWGKNWKPCTGLKVKMAPVADRVNPDKFYAFDHETGQLLESLDKAQTFGVRTEPVAAKGNYALIVPNPGVEGDVWIGAGEKVYHSTDSGVTFVVLAGMSKVYAMGFGKAANGAAGASVYMNGYVGGKEGMFRSEDGGRRWVRIDDPAHGFGWKNTVTGDPRVFGRVYLATGGRGIVYGEPAAEAVAAK